MKRIYVVISEIDYEEIGKFDSLKKAKEFIKDCKRFDVENGNPFNEIYNIEVRYED